MSLDRITRRDALYLLGAAAAAMPKVRAAGQGILSHATRVDHVSLAVGDIDKALIFYRRLFGNEVLKDNKTARRYLHMGPCYMSIAPVAAGETKRIDHFAVGIENFNASALKSALEKAGLKVTGGDDGLFVVDPDGTRVQIVANESWKQIKNTKPDTGPKQEVLFKTLGMHHLAIQVGGDMAKSAEFYGKLFGEATPGNGNPPQPTFQAGETRILLYNPSPTKPTKIDHFSNLVDNFDAAAALKVVQGLGANAKMSAQGTLNEFFDPDGIRLQVSFPGQTYNAPAPAKK